MQVTVDLNPKDIAMTMESEPNFGAEVLGEFLKELGRHPGNFAREALFRTAPNILADQLRALADEIERTGTR